MNDEIQKKYSGVLQMVVWLKIVLIFLSFFFSIIKLSDSKNASNTVSDDKKNSKKQKSSDILASVKEEFSDTVSSAVASIDLDSIEKMKEMGEDFINGSFDGEKVKNLVKELTAGTPTGDILQKIDNLVQENEIDQMRDEMQVSYEKRKKELLSNPLEQSINDFELIILSLLKEVDDEFSVIKNNLGSIKNNYVDLKDLLIEFKKKFENNPIDDNIMTLDFAIMAYCILEEENDLYRSTLQDLRLESLLHEYRYSMDRYMMMRRDE